MPSAGLGCWEPGLTALCPHSPTPPEPCLTPALVQQELSVALGRPLRLCCGRAERGGHWYKDGARLAPAGRVRGWRGRLEIASFLPQDAGHYLCLARGSLLVLYNLTLVADGKWAQAEVQGCPLHMSHDAGTYPGPQPRPSVPDADPAPSSDGNEEQMPRDPAEQRVSLLQGQHGLSLAL